MLGFEGLGAHPDLWALNAASVLVRTSCKAEKMLSNVKLPAQNLGSRPRNFLWSYV